MNSRHKKLIIFLIFIFCIFEIAISTAKADEYIHIGMWSKHFDGKEYRENHNLIGYENNNYFLYKYLNSNNKSSFYAGKIKRDWACYDDSKLCLGYSYGLISGYDLGSAEISPIAFPVISYEKDKYGFDITCLPSVVCAVQFRYNNDNYLSSLPSLDGFFIGGGAVIDADESQQAYTVGYQHKKWRLDYTYIGDYTTNNWYDSNPQWRRVAWEKGGINKHSMVGLTYRIYKKEFDKWRFFIDFGFSYTNKLSKVNSSHLLFRENFGIKYKDFSIYYRHTSNGGITGRNIGEDIIMIEYGF